MAQKAKKERAKANTASLKSLHLLSLTFNGLFILFSTFLRPRSLSLYFILSIPAFICQVVLERAGRPSYDATGALVSSGEDLNSPGLTEYLFDCVWVTWACLIAVMLLGNWGWYLWAAIPAYAGYLAYGLLGAAKFRATEGQETAGAAAPGGNRRQRRAAT
jgi:hypothetical protein